MFAASTLMKLKDNNVIVKDRDIDFGFVILAGDRNLAMIKSTLRSISHHYTDTPVVCVVAKETKSTEMKELKKLCPTYKGKTTFTSLINAGVHKTKEWSLVVVEGSIVRKGLVGKYARFLESPKDVMYPIVVDYDGQGRPVDLHTEFYNSSINGLLIHKNTLKEVGDFGDEPLEMARVLWATRAIAKGVQFKAILGTRLT